MCNCIQTAKSTLYLALYRNEKYENIQSNCHLYYSQNPTPRKSTEAIREKRKQAEVETSKPTSLYKSFAEFCERIKKLQLPEDWCIFGIHEDYALVKKKDKIHQSAVFEIYVDDFL